MPTSGMANWNLSPATRCEPWIEMPTPPRRIDLLTEIDGVTFENAYPNRLSIQVEGVNVPVIGRQDLLMNKKAAGRPQDLVDAAWLESESGERF